jgi:predicted AlkP superfamily pyrophosphatase or phosphodiesterase
VTVRSAVLLISIDGFSAALFQDASLKIPTLRALAARGVAAAGLRPAFPSVTWPCHTTLVTGVTPARHGILGNEVMDRATGRVVRHEGDPTDEPIRAATVWDAAAAAGLATAALCWPRTRGVRSIRDNVPEFLAQEDFEAWTSRPLWDEARALGLPIERYADWSSSRPLTPMQDWLTLELTRHVLRRRPPELLLTHLLMVDAFQHEFGPHTPEARWALEHVDGLVATLLAELASTGRLETTDVMVLGDHGFVAVEQRALPNAALHAAGLLSIDARGTILPGGARVTANGGSAHVYVGDARGAAERAREVLAATPGVAEVLGPETFADLGLPAPARDSTQGDLVLHAAEGWYFSSHATPERAAAASSYRGTHGHRTDDPRLHAAFLAAGPSIVEGARAGVLDQRDVAPTVAAILGLKLSAAERGAAPSVLRRG